jgi:hypothetical protein
MITPCRLETITTLFAANQATRKCSILVDALCLAYMFYLFADVFTELLVFIAGMETVSATRWTRLHGLLSLPGSWKLYVIFPL